MADAQALARLSREPGRVTCPACLYTDYTKFVADPNCKPSQLKSVTIELLLPWCIGSFARARLQKPCRGCHYCSNCGLRLAWRDGAVTTALAVPSIFDDSAYDYTQPPLTPHPAYDSDEMLPAYSATADMTAPRPARPALSPLGPPCGERPATFGQLSTLDLHRIKPYRMFRVAWDPETWVPTSIYDSIGRDKLFSISMPAFQNSTAPIIERPGPTVNRGFLPFKNRPKSDVKDKPEEGHPSSPHIRLCAIHQLEDTASATSSCKEVEIATARLYQNSWAAHIFRPATTAANLESCSVDQEVPNLALRIEPSENALNWRSPASVGQLTWRWPGSTSMGIYGHTRVCFDAYERPLAAHIDPYPPGTRAKHTAPSLPLQGRTWRCSALDPRIPAPADAGADDGRQAKGALTRLVLYAKVDDDLLAETLMGFAVLCAQARRYDVAFQQ